MIYVIRLNSPINLIENIHVLMPPASEFEIGFSEWVNSILNISIQTNSKITFWGYKQTYQKIQSIIEKNKYIQDVGYQIAECSNRFQLIAEIMQKNDLLVIISARKNTISHNKYIKQIPNQMETYFKDSNVLIIYPEQETVYRESIDLQV
jgi:hypothetical protein